MPQVDLSSVCAGDSKVACETLTGDEEASAQAEDLHAQPPQLDYAPESFWLSKDAELDWLDRNAFIERKDSAKGSQPHSTNLNPVHVSTGSNRFSGNLKSKPSIIGLPKPTKPNYAEAKSRRQNRAASIRLFPKRTGSIGSKPGTALSEPSSPKVSCMGRVRSKKDRSKRGKNRNKQPEPGLARNKSIKERKPGFWKHFRSMFRSKPKESGKEDEPEWETVAAVTKRSSSKRRRTLNFSGDDGGCVCDTSVASSSEPPGLGGVKRFTSGRRSDAWAAELEVDGAKSEPLDRGPIWRRRERGPPVEVEVDRDWQSVGPASV